MTIEKTTGGMLNKNLPDTFWTSIKSYDVLMTVIGILGVVSNSLLLIAMVRYRCTIFTSKGAYLIANMAIADLLTGLNCSRCMGLRITFQLSQALDKALYSIWWTSIEVSFLTILVMSLERYIAIVFPFKAQVWLSKARTIKSCVAVWLIAVLCGVCIALYPLIVHVCLTIFFEITILVIMFFYYKIIIKLRERRAILTSMQSTGTRSTRSNADLPREHKVTTVVVILVVILIITVLPYILATQISSVRRLFRVTNYDPKLQLFISYYFPFKMILVLNPIIYAWRFPNYRLALLRTLHCR